ncbi:hypothetical protein DID75_01585 [Candidatus Marinamargulisbacteria bacterium SCGC AG-410-N11]|nr:hypothetical protein DID75_01585 [Candidatus Marinamargulisbacteria bacterium SCGC AG-410-N11]
MVTLRKIFSVKGPSFLFRSESSKKRARLSFSNQNNSGQIREIYEDLKLYKQSIKHSDLNSLEQKILTKLLMNIFRTETKEETLILLDHLYGYLKCNKDKKIGDVLAQKFELKSLLESYKRDLHLFRSEDIQILIQEFKKNMNQFPLKGSILLAKLAIKKFDNIKKRDDFLNNISQKYNQKFVLPFSFVTVNVDANQFTVDDLDFFEKLINASSNALSIAQLEGVVLLVNNIRTGSKGVGLYYGTGVGKTFIIKGVLKLFANHFSKDRSMKNLYDKIIVVERNKQLKRQHQKDDFSRAIEIGTIHLPIKPFDVLDSSILGKRKRQELQTSNLFRKYMKMKEVLNDSISSEYKSLVITQDFLNNILSGKLTVLTKKQLFNKKLLLAKDKIVYSYLLEKNFTPLFKLLHNKNFSLNYKTNSLFICLEDIHFLVDKVNEQLNKLESNFTEEFQGYPTILKNIGKSKCQEWSLGLIKHLHKQLVFFKIFLETNVLFLIDEADQIISEKEKSNSLKFRNWVYLHDRRVNQGASIGVNQENNSFFCYLTAFPAKNAKHMLKLYPGLSYKLAHESRQLLGDYIKKSFNQNLINYFFDQNLIYRRFLSPLDIVPLENQLDFKLAPNSICLKLDECVRQERRNLMKLYDNFCTYYVESSDLDEPNSQLCSQFVIKFNKYLELIETIHLMFEFKDMFYTRVNFSNKRYVFYLEKYTLNLQDLYKLCRSIFSDFPVEIDSVFTRSPFLNFLNRFISKEDVANIDVLDIKPSELYKQTFDLRKIWLLIYDSFNAKCISRIKQSKSGVYSDEFDHHVMKYWHNYSEDLRLFLSKLIQIYKSSKNQQLIKTIKEKFKFISKFSSKLEILRRVLINEHTILDQKQWGFLKHIFLVVKCIKESDDINIQRQLRYYISDLQFDLVDKAMKIIRENFIFDPSRYSQRLSLLLIHKKYATGINLNIYNEQANLVYLQVPDNSDTLVQVSGRTDRFNSRVKPDSFLLKQKGSSKYLFYYRLYCLSNKVKDSETVICKDVNFNFTSVSSKIASLNKDIQTLSETFNENFIKFLVTSIPIDLVDHLIHYSFYKKINYGEVKLPVRDVIKKIRQGGSGLEKLSINFKFSQFLMMLSYFDDISLADRLYNSYKSFVIYTINLAPQTQVRFQPLRCFIKGVGLEVSYVCLLATSFSQEKENFLKIKVDGIEGLNNFFISFLDFVGIKPSRKVRPHIYGDYSEIFYDSKHASKIYNMLDKKNLVTLMAYFKNYELKKSIEIKNYFAEKKTAEFSVSRIQTVVDKTRDESRGVIDFSDLNDSLDRLDVSTIVDNIKGMYSDARLSKNILFQIQTDGVSYRFFGTIFNFLIMKNRFDVVEELLKIDQVNSLKYLLQPLSNKMQLQKQIEKMGVHCSLFITHRFLRHQLRSFSRRLESKSESFSFQLLQKMKAFGCIKEYQLFNGELSDCYIVLSEKGLTISDFLNSKKYQDFIKQVSGLKKIDISIFESINQFLGYLDQILDQTQFSSFNNLELAILKQDWDAIKFFMQLDLKIKNLSLIEKQRFFGGLDFHSPLMILLQMILFDILNNKQRDSEDCVYWTQLNSHNYICGLKSDQGCSLFNSGYQNVVKLLVTLFNKRLFDINDRDSQFELKQYIGYILKKIGSVTIFDGQQDKLKGVLQSLLLYINASKEQHFAEQPPSRLVKQRSSDLGFALDSSVDSFMEKIPGVAELETFKTFRNIESCVDSILDNPGLNDDLIKQNQFLVTVSLNYLDDFQDLDPKKVKDLVAFFEIYLKQTFLLLFVNKIKRKDYHYIVEFWRVTNTLFEQSRRLREEYSNNSYYSLDLLNCINGDLDIRYVTPEILVLFIKEFQAVFEDTDSCFLNSQSDGMDLCTLFTEFCNVVLTSNYYQYYDIDLSEKFNVYFVLFETFFISLNSEYKGTSYSLAAKRSMLLTLLVSFLSSVIDYSDFIGVNNFLRRLNSLVVQFDVAKSSFYSNSFAQELLKDSNRIILKDFIVKVDKTNFNHCKWFHHFFGLGWSIDVFGVSFVYHYLNQYNDQLEQYPLLEPFMRCSRKNQFSKHKKLLVLLDILLDLSINSNYSTNIEQFSGCFADYFENYLAQNPTEKFKQLFNLLRYILGDQFKEHPNIAFRMVVLICKFKYKSLTSMEQYKNLKQAFKESNLDYNFNLAILNLFMEGTKRPLNLNDINVVFTDLLTFLSFDLMGEMNDLLTVLKSQIDLWPDMLRNNDSTLHQHLISMEKNKLPMDNRVKNYILKKLGLGWE